MYLVSVHLLTHSVEHLLFLYDMIILIGFNVHFVIIEELENLAWEESCYGRNLQ